MLSTQNSIALTQAMAQKLFGQESALNKMIDHLLVK